MASRSSYDTVARAYADGVRSLLPPAVPAASGAAAAEFAASAPASTDAVTAQATELARRSAELRQATVADLASADSAERARASTRLLAQAVTDLQISAYLLQVARGRETDRTVRAAEADFPPFDIEETLAILIGDEAAFATRAAVMPPDLPSARGQLSGVVVATLSTIESRAAKTGQTAVSGLLVLGVGQVAHAAGIVGLDIAQALGVADKVTRLYALVRDYALSAYNALVALLGPAAAQSAAQQVLAWVNDVAAGEQFRKLLTQLYETKQTADHLHTVVIGSQADLSKFVIAIRDVDGLNTGFQQQIDLIDKLLRGFRLVSGAAAVAIPQATVLMAAAYIAIMGYAVLAGADYVDAERVKLLNRVPGVRQVVEQSLS
jgi:hypothetical protein